MVICYTNQAACAQLPNDQCQLSCTGEVQIRPEDGEKVHATFIFDCASLQRPDSAELQPAATLVVSCRHCCPASLPMNVPPLYSHAWRHSLS